MPPRPFCTPTESCEYHGTGTIQEICAPTPRSPSGPRKRPVHQRIVGKIPGVRMGRIDPAEGGEELPAFQLQIERQTGRLQKRFLDFDLGFVIVVEFENDVGEAFEVRIDRAIERELDVARVEAALLRIVIADFEAIEVARARISASANIPSNEMFM